MPLTCPRLLRWCWAQFHCTNVNFGQTRMDLDVWRCKLYTVNPWHYTADIYGVKCALPSSVDQTQTVCYGTISCSTFRFDYIITLYILTACETDSKETAYIWRLPIISFEDIYISALATVFKSYFQSSHLVLCCKSNPRVSSNVTGSKLGLICPWIAGTLLPVGWLAILQGCCSDPAPVELKPLPRVTFTPTFPLQNGCM